MGITLHFFGRQRRVLLYWAVSKIRHRLNEINRLISLAANAGLVYWLIFSKFIQMHHYRCMCWLIKALLPIICTAISSYLLFILAGKNTKEQSQTRIIIDQSVFLVSAVSLLFLSGFLEINHQFLNHYPGTALNILYLSLYIPAFIVLLNILSYKILPDLWRLRLALTVCCLALYFSFNTDFFALLYQMLKSGHPDPIHLYSALDSGRFYDCFDLPAHTIMQATF